MSARDILSDCIPDVELDEQTWIRGKRGQICINNGSSLSRTGEYFSYTSAAAAQPSGTVGAGSGLEDQHSQCSIQVNEALGVYWCQCRRLNPGKKYNTGSSETRPYPLGEMEGGGGRAYVPPEGERFTPTLTSR